MLSSHLLLLDDKSYMPTLCIVCKSPNWTYYKNWENCLVLLNHNHFKQPTKTNRRVKYHEPFRMSYFPIAPGVSVVGQIASLHMWHWYKNKYPCSIFVWCLCLVQIKNITFISEIRFAQQDVIRINLVYQMKRVIYSYPIYDMSVNVPQIFPLMQDRHLPLWYYCHHAMGRFSDINTHCKYIIYVAFSSQRTN